MYNKYEAAKIVQYGQYNNLPDNGVDIGEGRIAESCRRGIAKLCDYDYFCRIIGAANA